MVEILTLEGPLEPGRLRWVAELYGLADPKYRELEVLEHLFTRGPAGPALHAFALDDGQPVGHCAVVPMPARRGHEELRCGKVEALFVAESHRGRRDSGEPVVLTLLGRLYAYAEERGLELLHAYVRPEVGRLFLRFGFEALPLGERSLVAVSRPSTLSSTRLRAWGLALAAAQTAAQVAASGLARLATTRRRAEAILRVPTAVDVDLVDAPPPPPDRWTVLASDAWDWYRASPWLRVLELDGPHGSCALVQLPGSPGDPVRLVGWRPRSPGLVPALLLLREAARVARRTGAGTLRFQPWASPAGDGTLERACRLLGFVARSDFTTLYVRARDPGLARSEAVAPTPLLYLGF
jgi:GNAT superfamily N-acetyltransferase